MGKINIEATKKPDHRRSRAELAYGPSLGRANCLPNTQLPLLAAAAAGGECDQQSGSDRVAKPGAADQREALFNGGVVGTFKEVMVQRHEVTLLRGILIEIDGECLRVGNVVEEMPTDGHELYERYVRGWLDNHAVLRKAEVRFSGRWLHCILRFATPVEIKNDRQRELWDAIVHAVQGSLPSDPAAPRLLAMTRPIGSVSSKTGRKVELINTGEPVSEADVLGFADELARRGFSTVMQILFGSTEVSPCPICQKEDSTLSAAAPNRSSTNPAISFRGSCYHCGKVDLASVIGLVLKGRDKEGGDKGGGEGGKGGEAAPAVVAAPDELDDQDCPFSISVNGQGDE